MPVVITCPACQRKARVSRSALGKTVKCPGCGTTFQAAREEDDAAPAPRNEPETEELPESPQREPATPEGEARRVERFGLGLLTLSEGLLAVSMALQLFANLLGLAIADGGTKSPLLQSFIYVAALIAVLGMFVAEVAALIGAVCCLLLPATLSMRAAAASILV